MEVSRCSQYGEGSLLLPQMKYSKDSRVGSELKGCATKITRISSSTASVTGGYHEHEEVLYRVVALDEGVRVRVVQREAQVAEDPDEQIDREADEVLFGQHFMHSSQRRLFQLFEALQQVDLRGEAENEHRERGQRSRKLEHFQLVELQIVVAHVCVEGRNDGDDHQVDDRHEAQKRVYRQTLQLSLDHQWQQTDLREPRLPKTLSPRISSLPCPAARACPASTFCG